MISQLFHLQSRQDSNNFYREFENCGHDFNSFLQRKQKLKKYFPIIENQVLKSPLLTISQHWELFRKENSEIKISIASFRNFYNQIDCAKYKRSIDKWITNNELRYDEMKIVKEIMNDSKNNNIKIINPKLTDKYQESESEITKQIKFKQELSSYALSILVVFLTACGLNFDVLAILLGTSKSTVWRHYSKMSFLKSEMLGSVKHWSGKVSFDEKWVWVNKRWKYVLSAVDDTTGFLLYYHITDSLKAADWEIFFVRFKQLYGTPKLVITDGSKSLAWGLRSVYPNVVHQLCKFHKLKNLYKRIYRIKDYDKRERLLKLASGIFNNKSHFARKRALLRMISISPKYVSDYLEKNILADWSKLTRCYTSNSVERWNRKIEKAISKRYGIKTSKFLDTLIAGLWMKEAIKNQIHLKKGFIQKLNIPKTVNENVKMCNIIDFIRQNLLQDVA